MKFPQRVSLSRNENDEEKHDYANYRNTRIMTIFQIPHYDRLQILICNGNSLTTLAGIEHIKHLWKLDVGNNQIRSLQHLSRFIALGFLNLSNNRLQWIELQHIRHMFILELRIDGNTILDADPNYRQHIVDSLPRVWMCDGIFISTCERNDVEEFFTQASLLTKPVRRKLARDSFMPTNLKDRSVNGLFGHKATDLFAKFPMNCFINAELDRKRLKYLASNIQETFLTEIRRDSKKKEEKFLDENRFILHRLIDVRINHVEEFNTFLILLMADLISGIPIDFLDEILDTMKLRTIDDLPLSLIFGSTTELKVSIGSLLLAGIRLDRDENQLSTISEKLFQSLNVTITNLVRETPLNSNAINEAKTIITLEVLQVLILCPTFYSKIHDSAISSIIQLALERSPAYESIKDVLQNLNVDSKTAEEQKDLLSPILGNIIKMTIRTLSNKRTKKNNDSTSAVGFSSSKVEDENSNQEAATRPSPRLNRSAIHRVPTIGDRILTAPQSFARIVTIPDGEIAMIQFDQILAINGSMITNGSLNDHTNYVNMNHFEWDPVHEYWKPKNTQGDKITLHMTNILHAENHRPTIIPGPNTFPVRGLSAKVNESLNRSRLVSKRLEPNLRKPKEAFVEPVRPQTPTLESRNETSLVNEGDISIIRQESSTDQVMSVRINKSVVETRPEENSSMNSPVLLESMFLLMPEQQSQINSGSNEQIYQPNYSNAATYNDFDQSSTNYRRSVQPRVPVPVHNASIWFNGPDMQNERAERMEKVVLSLFRRSHRSSSYHSASKIPNLTSPSSKEHALSKGIRSAPVQEITLGTQRIAPMIPSGLNRISQSGRERYWMARSFDPNRTYHSSPNVTRVRPFTNMPCPSPT